MAKRFSLVAALFVVLLPAVSWAQRSTTFGKDLGGKSPFHDHRLGERGRGHGAF